jgi:hypothetical protein
MASNLSDNIFAAADINEYLRSFTIICNSNKHIAYLQDENDIIIAKVMDLDKNLRLTMKNI